jgi:predicted nuclease of predicted toxin-antitoxin system
MRFLVDQDVYKLTIDRLREWGHDVVTVKELGLQRSPDDDLLRIARAKDRLLITRDKGFGAIVFLNKTIATGVIMLKVTPTTTDAVHQEIRHLLEEHSEEELRRLFCAVEPRRHRIRQIL